MRRIEDADYLINLFGYGLRPANPRFETRRGIKRLKGIGIPTWIKQGYRKVVGLVNCRAKYDSMEKGTSSARLVGNDEHVPSSTSGGARKNIFGHEDFRKNKNQRIGEPARHRQHTDNLEQRYEEDQGFQNGCYKYRVDGFAGINAPPTKVSSGEPMNPGRQTKENKRE